MTEDLDVHIDPATVAWVAQYFIPFEATFRLHLRRYCTTPAELDDLVQDVYFRVLRQKSLAHVRDPKAFLLQSAKNVVTDRLRHDAVVDIQTVPDLDQLYLPEQAPSTEQVVAGRSELKWVLGLVAELPERCREVFSARKIFGLSQTETAASLGLTENVVEKETIKGFRLIFEMSKRVRPQEAVGEAANKSTPTSKGQRNV